MPEVVSDTSPLQYLHQAGLLHLLPALYGHIVVPEGVVAELERGISLGFLVPDVHATPWIHVERICLTAIPQLPTDFGAGEREVLALARRTSNSLSLDRRCSGAALRSVTGNQVYGDSWNSV